MSYELTGEYECKLDGRGRVRLPGALVDQFDESVDTFVINRGYEKNLMLYPKNVWDIRAKEINQLKIHNTMHRKVIRYFYRGATTLKLDKVSRILIPPSLAAYAGLDKNIIFFAYQGQIEIWSKKNYDAMISDEPEDFSAIADEVFGSGQEES